MVCLRPLAVVLVVYLLGGCTAVDEVTRYEHSISPFDDPSHTLGFSSELPGELESIWIGDSDLTRLTTTEYELYIDVGVRSWVDHTAEPGYLAEPIHLLGHNGELLRFRYTYTRTNNEVCRATIRWRDLAIRVWADAETEYGRERAIETARTLHWSGEG